MDVTRTGENGQTALAMLFAGGLELPQAVTLVPMLNLRESGVQLSRKVQYRVQSNTISGRGDCGGKKYGTRAVYEGANCRTVYTNNRTRTSVCDA
jgi:hypothetical protein